MSWRKYFSIAKCSLWSSSSRNSSFKTYSFSLGYSLILIFKNSRNSSFLSSITFGSVSSITSSQSSCSCLNTFLKHFFFFTSFLSFFNCRALMDNTLACYIDKPLVCIKRRQFSSSKARFSPFKALFNFDIYLIMDSCFLTFFLIVLRVLIELSLTAASSSYFLFSLKFYFVNSRICSW